ncbi:MULTISPECIES: hypothetical protein [unclassified Acidovorax]|jgi:hypothetical protein|nr:MULTISPECIES: hypothetical protein [unclassified Acidovorax]MBV7460320.1 hypothetical protein [Acidovorax sp. sif0632]MBV7465345.1 hypothetical protein [Acidovorax sp. sif0613]
MSYDKTIHDGAFIRLGEPYELRGWPHCWMAVVAVVPSGGAVNNYLVSQ